MSHPFIEKGMAFEKLETAIALVLGVQEIATSIEADHLIGTPTRVSKAFKEYFAGCWQKPEDVLKTTFSGSGYDEMVYVNNIEFASFCAHHFAPFVGKVHFAYIPDKKIVGLSKIPRLIEVFAKRPQVQEKLAEDVVDAFNRIVKPKGCGIIIEAYHMCMMLRGIKKEQAFTKTTALRGNFKTSDATRNEFLNGVPKGGQIWP